MNKHSIPKTPQERSNFKRYIREQDYEPTLNDRVIFSESDQSDRDYSISTSNSTRQGDSLIKFKEFFQENWISLLISVFGIILFFFMVDSKVDLATLFQKTDQIKEDVGIVKQDIDKIKEDNHKQDLDIQEIRIKNEREIAPTTKNK